MNFLRKPATIDIEHMKMLHEEAIDQLELMQSVLAAREEATGTMRDGLENMTLEHWNAYLDVIHLISMHDEAIASILQQHGLSFREESNSGEVERQYVRPLLLSLLSAALVRRHRRIRQIYSWHARPISDYLNESMNMERKHLVELIAMVENLL